MKPLKSNILVNRIAPDLTTSSGIILKSAIESDKACVVSIGPDATEVSVGDVVMLDWNNSTDIGNNQYIVNQKDIILIID